MDAAAERWSSCGFLRYDAAIISQNPAVVYIRVIFRKTMSLSRNSTQMTQIKWYIHQILATCHPERRQQKEELYRVISVLVELLIERGGSRLGGCAEGAQRAFEVFERRVD